MNSDASGPGGPGSASFGDPGARVAVEARRDGRAVRIRVGAVVAVLTPSQAHEVAVQLDDVLDELAVAPQVRTPSRLLQARVARHLGIVQSAVDRL